MGLCTLRQKTGGGGPAASTLTPARITESGAQVAGTSHQSRVTSHQVTLLFILQSAGFVRTAIRGQSTGHRSGIPCVPPSPEFLRLVLVRAFRPDRFVFVQHTWSLPDRLDSSCLKPAAARYKRKPKAHGIGRA